MASAAAESLPPDEETAPGSMPPVARGHPASGRSVGRRFYERHPLQGPMVWDIEYFG